MRYLILVLFLPIILAGCINAANNTGDAPIDTGVVEKELPVNTSDTEESLVGQVVSVDMTVKQWIFQPSTVTVSQGDRVKLNIKSLDVTHGFALPDFGVSKRLEPGKTTSVEFVADKKGTFTFFCNVVCGSGHPDMKGILIVK